MVRMRLVHGSRSQVSGEGVAACAGQTHAPRDDAWAFQCRRDKMDSARVMGGLGRSGEKTRVSVGRRIRTRTGQCLHLARTGTEYRCMKAATFDDSSPQPPTTFFDIRMAPFRVRDQKKTSQADSIVSARPDKSKIGQVYAFYSKSSDCKNTNRTDNQQWCICELLAFNPLARPS